MAQPSPRQDLRMPLRWNVVKSASIGGIAGSSPAAQSPSELALGYQRRQMGLVIKNCLRIGFSGC